MIKLVKYARPFLGSILLCVALIFGQAMCDLKLPDYMSDIVNTGVQRYGIEDSVPLVISRSTLELLAPLLTEEERALLSASYQPLSPDMDGYARLSRDYPNAQSAQTLALGPVSKADRQALDAGFTRAFFARSTYGQQAGLSGLNDLSPDQRAEALSALDQAVDKAGDTVAGQAAVSALREEYARLGADTAAIQRGSILRTGGSMLLVALMGCAFAVGAGLLGSRVAAGVAKSLRRDVFAKAVSFGGEEISRFSTASLITRTTNDIQQVQQLTVMVLRMVIYAPVMGIGGILYALNKSVSMSWIIALAVVVLLSLVATIFTVTMPRFKRLQRLIDRLNQVTRENLSGIMVSKAYNAQDFEQRRFEQANQELTQTHKFVNRVMVSMMPAMNIVMNGVSLLIIWVGAGQIAQSALQVGDMMAYMQYAMQVVMSFLVVSAMFIMIPRAAVSGDRIYEVLSTENAVQDPPRSKGPGLDGQTGQIEFQNVSFRFPGAEEDTLQDISFTARPGQTTAFIGATGSGKTTLVNLVPRFYDVTQGRILVNGVDVRDMTQQELRGQIGYAPQKGILFAGTIAENLRLGDENAPDQRLEWAADIAQAKDFIAAKSMGMQEQMSQGGTNVSGGQRQRLSIARALTVDAPIYIFDDSFSALDFQTDAALRRALHERVQGKTLLIVAQRISTIRGAEQIIVLDEGRVAGKGTHEQLMRDCPVYQAIARSQLREEELL